MQILPLALTVSIAVTIALFILALSFLIGPRRHSPRKDEPFECGFQPEVAPRRRIPVKFYVVAALFLVFDIEVIFLFPWAVNFRVLGWLGFIEMLVFAGVLAAGLWYVWVGRGLEWE